VKFSRRKEAKDGTEFIRNIKKRQEIKEERQKITLEIHGHLVESSKVLISRGDVRI